MSHRHLIAILTAIVRAQKPELEGDAAVMQAIEWARDGAGEAELVAAIETILGGDRREWDLLPTRADILRDVDYVLAMRAALGKPPTHP
jgi:hypothetical protein